MNNAHTDRFGRWGHGTSLWTLAVFLAVSPFIFSMCVDLWRMPVPLSEAVGLLEDVAQPPVSRFFVAESSYYRPLYYVTLSAIWNSAEPLDVRLSWIRLTHIVPIIALVALFIWHLRPRTLLDAAAATIACAVLVGSPGFRDNLEIPLTYTIVGMPLVLMAWILVNRQWRLWHGAVLLLLALVAIGFKEQGLVVVPVVVAAWWAGAPGARRGIIAALALLAVGYVLFRLQWRGNWPLFEQALGLGFRELNPAETTARFSSFPYWMYAYNAVSTIGNILFSEPTRGVFRIVRGFAEGRPQLWELNHLVSSTGMTVLIAWWGINSLRRSQPWSYESRAFVVMIVAVLACGALSFNYSRDRLGGMAVVFYALSSFLALRTLAGRAAGWTRRQYAAAAVAVLVLAGTWQVRAIGTVEYVRVTALRNQREWLVDPHERRRAFADRPTFLRIMESLIPQGLDPAAPQPTRYPRLITRALGWP